MQYALGIVYAYKISKGLALHHHSIHYNLVVYNVHGRIGVRYVKKSV